MLQVHRAILTFESGVFVTPGEFKEEEWLLYTDRYTLEAQEMKNEKWPSILHAVKPLVEKMNQSTRKGKKTARRSDPNQPPPRATMPDSDPIEPESV